MKLIIISNRLPVKIEKNGNGEFTVSPSEGGLATGLGSFETEAEKIWIGWPGIFTDDEDEKKRDYRTPTQTQLLSCFSKRRADRAIL